MGAETLMVSLGLGLLASLIICADAGKVGGRRSHDSSDVGGGCVGARFLQDYGLSSCTCFAYQKPLASFFPCCGLYFSNSQNVLAYVDVQ